MSDRHNPVFIDHSGRRWRRIRRAALVLGVVTTLIALVLVGSELFYPPMPPELPLAVADQRDRAKPITRHAGPSRRSTGCASRTGASWRRR